MVQTLRKPVFFLLAIVIVLALGAFSFTYTVPFNERAVVTFFGSADEANVKTDAGLEFKWPYPFQSVTSYDTRMQLVEAVGTQQQTADDKQLVIEAYAVWRVRNPLVFYRKFSNSGPNASDHYAEAESTVRSSLNSAISETSRFRMDQLFSPKAGASKLGDLESAILAVVRRDAGDPDAADGLGIEIVDVGINRIRLSESNSKDVIERMKADRQRLAQETISAGEAAAQSIRSQADRDAQRITSFAELQASKLKAAGDREAGRYIASMQESPELATLLEELQFIRDAYSKQITLVVSGAPGFRMLQPGYLDKLLDSSQDSEDKNEDGR